MKATDYFSYLQDHLGLEHVILTEPHKDIGIYCVGEDGQLHAEESEMLYKMIAAMKLSLNQVRIVTATENPNTFCEPLSVVFTSHIPDKELGVWSTVETSQVLYTYSLSSMLKDTRLKKPCWAHLQTVIEKKNNLH